MRTDLLIVSNPTEMEWLVMGEKDAASVLVQKLSRVAFSQED